MVRTSADCANAPAALKASISRAAMNLLYIIGQVTLPARLAGNGQAVCDGDHSNWTGQKSRGFCQVVTDHESFHR